MAISSRFHILTRRCSKLRDRFLPRKFSHTGIYSELQLDRARAYRLLIHAEVEAYIEDRVTAIAKSSVLAWASSGTLTKPLLGLLAFAKSTDPPDPSLGSGKGMITFRLEKTLGHFLAKVHENHGIRKANLFSLLLPVGLDELSLDANWIAQMDSFGVARGSVAHQSSVPGLITYQIDPKSEYETVQSLLSGLKKLDGYFEKVVRPGWRATISREPQAPPVPQVAE